MNSSIIQSLAIGLAIAVIWGYFADLRNGEVGWFIGRLIFMPLFVLLISNYKWFTKSK
ncbi:RND transporter [Oceanobacillus picturae]|uniref:RND transporter n=1 Tax=Oceanobacillus picturae TaxID=171693 RepID=A0A0U9HBW5_9BACI|nr:hypothetical protein [Oceanobacillus picturae]GAQ17604.1 RND transporter [Oceanobacillus picturae]